MALIKLFTFIKVVIIIFIFNNAIIGTYFILLNISNMIKEGFILLKKNKHNKLGLCCYCGKQRYIAIDYKNFALLATNK